MLTVSSPKCSGKSLLPCGSREPPWLSKGSEGAGETSYGLSLLESSGSWRDPRPARSEPQLWLRVALPTGGPHATALPGSAPRPARGAPRSHQRPPRPAERPPPDRPAPPPPRPLPRAPEPHGAGEPADSWHRRRWHVGCLALPPAASGARSQLSRRRRRAGDREREGGRRRGWRRRRRQRAAGRRCSSPGRARAASAAGSAGLRRPPGPRPRAATWLRSARCCPACCPCTVRSAPPRAAGPQVRAGRPRGVWGARGSGCPHSARGAG